MIKRIKEYTGRFTEEDIKEYTPLELTYILMRWTSDLTDKKNLLSQIVIDLKTIHSTGEVRDLTSLPHEADVADPEYSEKEVKDLVSLLEREYFFYIPIERRKVSRD